MFVCVVLFGVRFLSVFGFVLGCVRVCSVFGVWCLGSVLLCSVFGSDVMWCSVFGRRDDIS